MFSTIMLFVFSVFAEAQKTDCETLKDAFAGKFLIGTALNHKQYSGQNEKSAKPILKPSCITTTIPWHWHESEMVPSEWF